MTDDHLPPQGFDIPDRIVSASMRCGVIVNNDDPTDIAVIVEFGPYRALLTIDGAREFSDALASEAAYAATIAAGYPAPRGRVQ